MITVSQYLIRIIIANDFSALGFYSRANDFEYARK